MGCWVLLVGAAGLLLVACGPLGGSRNAGDRARRCRSADGQRRGRARDRYGAIRVLVSADVRVDVDRLGDLGDAPAGVQGGPVRDRALRGRGMRGKLAGLGLQIASDLVVTVAHVVDQGQVIRVVEGTTSTAGSVIGLEQGADVALVRTAVPLHGHAFAFAGTAPAVGDQVAALGFPRGEPLSFSPAPSTGSAARPTSVDSRAMTCSNWTRRPTRQ